MRKLTHQNSAPNTRPGFTFVELSLAILFVSLLSLTVAVVANSILAIAEKGFSLKSVNSVGSDLISGIQTAVSGSPAADFDSICNTVYTDLNTKSSPAQAKCKLDQAFDFIYSDRKGSAQIVGSSEPPAQDVQYYGIFCTGRYSYVWNTGYVLSEGIYTDASGTPLSNYKASIKGYQVNTIGGVKNHGRYENFRLLRFEDSNREICASRIVDIHNLSTGYGTVTKIPEYDFTNIVFPSEPVELIPGTDNDLALYNFYLARPSQDSATSRIFYAGSFVLATLRGGVNISATGDYCQLTGQTADFNYCAVNKFNFAAQASGK